MFKLIKFLMPQLNENLMDTHIIGSFIFLIGCDLLTVLADTDDDLLLFNNAILLGIFSV
jgi:hypothetical protein